MTTTFTKRTGQPNFANVGQLSLFAEETDSSLYFQNESDPALRLMVGTEADESKLAALDANIATQSEAEAGLDNSKRMTSLRVSQAIDAQAVVAVPGIVYISDASDFPTPSGGFIDLPDALYVITASIVIFDTLRVPPGGNVSINSLQNINAAIVKVTPGDVFNSTDFGNFTLDAVTVVVISAGTTIYNLTTNSLTSAVCAFQNNIIVQADPLVPVQYDLGSIDMSGSPATSFISVVLCAWSQFTDGLHMIGGGSVIQFVGSQIVFGGDIGEAILNFDSGIFSTIDINNCKLTPTPGAYGLDFNTGATYVEPPLVSVCSFSGALGGVPFDPAGYDQTFVNVVGCVGIPNSNVIGTMYWKRNSTETIISKQGFSGVILSFADAGGGLVTVTTSESHGLANGEFADISESTVGYNDRFSVSNVTATTFDITTTFLGNDTAFLQTQWFLVSGTTIEGDVERCTMSNNNELTFSNNEPFTSEIKVSISGIRGAGSGSPTVDFCIFKNGRQDLTKNNDVIIVSMQLDATVPNSVVLINESVVSNSDIYNVYVRNVSNTSNVIVENSLYVQR